MVFQEVAMIIHLLLLALLVVQISVAQELWCPPGTSEASDGFRCFTLVDKLSYGDAEESCMELGGSLAVIKRKEDIDQIRDLGQENRAPHLWIGEMKTGKNSAWKWASQEQINALPQYSPLEFAKMTLMLIEGSVAFVQNCYHAPAVCQVEKSPRPEEYECPYGGAPSADKRDCFVAVGLPDSKVEFDSSDLLCSQLGGSLAWLNSQQDIDIVNGLSMIRDGDMAYWLGGYHPTVKLSWGPKNVNKLRHPSAGQLNLAILKKLYYLEGSCIVHGSICRIQKNQCPAGWIFDDVRGKCFMQGTSKKPISWREAENQCAASNGHLASILSDEENEMLGKIALGLQLQGPIWIGAINEAGLASDNAQWKWISGAAWGFSVWKTPPQNSPGTPQCAQFDPASSLWTSTKCGETSAELYVCEKEPTLSDIPAVYNPCPSGWFHFGDNCYQYFSSPNRQKISRTESQEKCRLLGSQLASIHSEREHHFVASLANSTAYKAAMWIGLEIGPHNSSFAWSDGSPFDFNAFSQYEDHNTESYAQIVPSFKNMGWSNYADYGTKTYYYVCKFSLIEPSVNPCPNGWSHHGGYCYMYFIEGEKPHEKKISWTEANQRCRDQNSHLASIHSERENLFAASLAQSVENKDSPWIGLIVGENNSTLKWSDGTPYDYGNWETSNPKLRNDLSYGEIILNHKTFTWMNYPNAGTSTHKYICKFDLSPCPSGWFNFGDNCYQYFSSPNKNIISRTESHEKCRLLGSQLASIHSEKEHHFVASLANSSAYEAAMWIGLEIGPHNSSFAWSDGSPFDFNAFSKYQDRDIESYAQIVPSLKNMGWSNYEDYGTETYYYVCKFSLIESPVNAGPAGLQIGFEAESSDNNLNSYRSLK
uniref:C-type lectin domain-containing protein n=1 Tax=Steinernema glaseri TaxID=37863 RepID=A0A1I7Z1L0_9BILA